MDAVVSIDLQPVGAVTAALGGVADRGRGGGAGDVQGGGGGRGPADAAAAALAADADGLVLERKITGCTYVKRLVQAK